MYFELFVSALFGLLFGSFLNVVILRVPNNTFFQSSRSECPKCNSQLKWYHNIPVFSWIFLRGKCGFCKESISIQYPIIEILTSVLAACVYNHFGSISIQSVFTFLSLTMLLSMSVIDIKFKLAPDSLNYLAMLFAVLSYLPDFIKAFESFTYVILFMGGFLFIKYMMEFILNKELLGEADIIVAGTIGALLGIKMGMTAIFISALISIIPALYFKFKYKDVKQEDSLPIDALKKMRLQLDLLEADYNDKMKTITQSELEKFWNKLDGNDNKLSIPYIPPLFVAVLITMIFNVNFY